MPMTLCYWDIHGLAHAIWLLPEYTDSCYEEKRYTMKDPPDYDRSQWLNEFKLSLEFLNLPYLIDGSHKITQSNAILRYAARKNNLCGETEEKIRVEILEIQAIDVSSQLGRVCYSPDFEKLKAQYLEQLSSQFLGKQTWFVSEKITFVDFLAYNILDLHLLFEPTCLDAFLNLKDFVACFEELRKISAYMKTSHFL
ncbi:glutathione S-transferase Mu 1-like isoform X1 [Mus caroli]|uniref:Glutathione S-transferase Mu 4 n=1 Tax=Mus caroli TaxID=10089 RepID=A0A6P5QE33_MUSCR|nr:glutathione S-transferase Mu 1-like isoform X1 [Mus caroli]